jgi:hypothetical protein
MKIDGQCHCGYLRYEAEVDPMDVVICHCADCQILSGSAFSVTVPAKPGSFRMLAGEPSIYLKIADSGNRRVQGFCPRCGTRLYSGPDGGLAGSLGLRVGAITQRAALVPKEQIWRRSAHGWVDAIAAIVPKSETE